MVGNANASVVVSVRNTGGRTLRIKALRLAIARDGKPLVTLPGQNYFETSTAETAVLFVPFMLKHGESWAHSVSFLNEFDRLTEKLFRESESALSADIKDKLNNRPEGDKSMVIADSKIVDPFHQLFKSMFIWLPGEYVATLQVDAEPGSASFTKHYRFTLYESDTRDLAANTEDYKYGGGISYKVATHSGVNVPLAEHVG